MVLCIHTYSDVCSIHISSCRLGQIPVFLRVYFFWSICECIYVCVCDEYNFSAVDSYNPGENHSQTFFAVL